MPIECNVADFIAAYNDIEKYPTIADVAKVFGISVKTVRNKAGFLRQVAKTDPSAPKMIPSCDDHRQPDVGRLVKIHGRLDCGRLH